MDILEYIKHCTCAATTVEYAKNRLVEAGFTELKMEEEWSINQGEAYFINVYDTTLVAFRVGKRFGYTGMVRLATAHTDQPAIAIKANPELNVKGYGKVNVEIYGGPILSSWFDRPLSVAGKVALKSEDVFCPTVRIVDFKRPLFTIPNLAIHMNREVNKGVEIERQKDMLPLACMLEQEFNNSKFFIKALAEELSCEVEDILDFQLYAYNCEEGSVLGLNREFIQAPRLDNITSVKACVEGLIKGYNEKVINMIALFDNEEVGNKTKQGAASLELSYILRKLFIAISRTEEQFIEIMHRSMMVSLDVAHAYHPNYPEKADITNDVILNKGMVIKKAASQSYATDVRPIAVAQQICEKYNIPYQKYFNRSNIPGGSTLGSVSSTILPVNTLDAGVPVLAMHSAKELMGVKDQQFMEEFVEKYFAEK